MDERQRDRIGFTLIELLVVLLVIAVLAVLALPALLSSQISSNERATSASMKTIATAETDFRSNDRGSNNVRDFWTGDLARLFAMTSAAASGTADDPIKLIDVALASCDSGPLGPGDAGGEYGDITEYGEVSPKAGYWISVLDMDGSSNDNYQKNTGGNPDMGAVHN